MLLVGTLQLEKFIKESGETSHVINSWRCEVEEDNWKNVEDILEKYKSAKFIEPNSLLFFLKVTTEFLAIKVKYFAETVLIESVRKVGSPEALTS